ncbi:hypothetical protein BGW42_007388 [Actinomortierella wolfii]|nr:hypothetical protein BGW42_007388 [Actinomortierella wolfii]
MAPNEAAPFARQGSSPPNRFTSPLNTTNHPWHTTTATATATTNDSIREARSPTAAGESLHQQARRSSKSGGDGGVSRRNSAVTGKSFVGSGSSSSSRSISPSRAGPSIIDLSSGEELVALHLGENEHKRRRDSTCSLSGNGYHDTNNHSNSNHNNHSSESLREVFDVQDDGTLLPVWDHAPALPSKKKKVKLDGRAASPLRSIDLDEDELFTTSSIPWNSRGGGIHGNDDDNDVRHDHTVFGSKAGGYFRRFSASSSSSNPSHPFLDATSPCHMDMGPYRDVSSSWRHHRTGSSRYHSGQDGWLGDDETPSSHSKTYGDNNRSRSSQHHAKASSGSKAVDGHWALVKHSGTRVSLVPGVDELLKTRPTSCLSGNTTTSSGPQQQLVLYRRPACQLYSGAKIEELKDDDGEDGGEVEEIQVSHPHYSSPKSTGVTIEEIDEDDGVLADDEHSSPRPSARIHEIDTDDDLEMDAGDQPAPTYLRPANMYTSPESDVLGIEEQIMGMDLD